jgi:hypothetical protein
MHIAETVMNEKEHFKTATSPVSAFEVICFSLATENRQEPVKKEAPARNQLNITTVKAEPAVSQPVSVQPVKTEAVKEPEPEPVTPVQPTEKISTMRIIELLVQCTKAHKVADEKTFAQMRTMMSLESRKYISLLQDTYIGASGADCIVLITRAQAVANRINDPEINRELYQFTKTQLNTDKVIFAITENDLKEASALFRIMMRDNSLPEAYKVHKYSEEEIHEDTPEDKVIALFGRENVEIIGGQKWIFQNSWNRRRKCSRICLTLNRNWLKQSIPANAEITKWL